MENTPRKLSVGIVDVTFGEKVTVIEPANLYGCSIGNNSFVGPFVEIQRHVSVGQNTRIQSHSFICEYVDIGDHCFVAHGVMFINDLFKEGKPDPNVDNWKKTKIGNHVSIGSNATILPIEVCDNVVIGAGAVVTKDIDRPGIYAGNPAKLIRELPSQ